MIQPLFSKIALDYQDVECSVLSQFRGYVAIVIRHHVVHYGPRELPAPIPFPCIQLPLQWVASQLEQSDVGPLRKVGPGP